MQVIGCKYGQALVVNQIGIFVEGGTGTSKFTTEEDKHVCSNILQAVQFE